MKTIYKVSCDDMSLNHGTFEDISLAQLICDQANAFNPELGRMELAVILTEIQVFEPGDPIFTHVAIYNVLHDTYSVIAIAPTMFEHWGGFEVIRQAMLNHKDQGAFGRAGTSEEDALHKLTNQIETLKDQGLVDAHRTKLLERA
jgi:hypothetical protein